MTSTRHIPVADAGPTVGDVMLRGARAVAPDSRLADARETFANPKVKLLLVTEGERFVGTLTPKDVPADGDGPIAPYVQADAPRVAPEDPVQRALDVVDATGLNRVPVVDANERLQGLVCFNRAHASFCTNL